MPLIPMRVLLDHAAENGYGVAALNVNNMEQIQAIMEAAVETDSPVIVQASRGARQYSNDNYLRHLMLAAAELHEREARSDLLEGLGREASQEAVRTSVVGHRHGGSLRDALPHRTIPRRSAVYEG